MYINHRSYVYVSWTWQCILLMIIKQGASASDGETLSILICFEIWVWEYQLSIDSECYCQKIYKTKYYWCQHNFELVNNCIFTESWSTLLVEQSRPCVVLI